MNGFVAVAVLAVVGCSVEHQSGSVIACNTAADCPANLPMCMPDSKICVGCTSDFQTCGPNKTCDDATHTCVPAGPDAGCKRNADCPRPGVDPSGAFVCEVDSGFCYGCTTSGDCPAGTCTEAHICDFGDAGMTTYLDLAVATD